MSIILFNRIRDKIFLTIAFKTLPLSVVIITIYGPRQILAFKNIDPCFMQKQNIYLRISAMYRDIDIS